MNFMYEIRPCADQLARREDGSVDIRRIEMLSRQRQREALSNAVLDLLAALGRGFASARRNGRRRGLREA
jgi:hypothetical protein